MADKTDWLKLQVGSAGNPVNADAFLDIFQNTIAALKSIDRGFSTQGVETISWEVVEVGSNSPIYAGTLHTYDKKLFRFDGKIGWPALSIKPPSHPDGHSDPMLF